ncbi:MAG: porphobilinogen synthase [Chloroflexi bacterium]|nr:porphobilinogen synthase [Chloroflexota bacterium]
MSFQRLRRLRRTPALRRLVRETTLSVDHLIYPLFVTDGYGIRREIGAMPNCYQLSVDQLAAEAEALLALGVPGVLLFGVPEVKDAVATSAYVDDGVIQRAIRALKRCAPDLLVITDVCCCEYTDHGHCGILVDGDVDNDQTLAVLERIALSHAAAGADVIAPSDMMDGRVSRIRETLDATGFTHLPIMAYAAKYASACYGPFRDAAGSTPQFGDRRSHQMDPANGREALREIAVDLDEGADVVMIKPALAYLDVLARARDRFDVPLAAYNVSGEYAMVKAAAERGWLDEQRTALEMLTAIRRAGADIIITYWARDVARWLERPPLSVADRRPATTSAPGG